MIDMENIVRRIYDLPEIDQDLLAYITEKRKAKGRCNKSMYSDLFVYVALNLYKIGLTFSDIEKSKGVSRNTVRLWASEYLGVILK